MVVTTKNGRVILEEEEWILSPMRGMYWPSEKLLVIADLHLGKTGHFRQHGMAIPGNVTERDLAKLQSMLEEFHPNQLIIAGDMLHAKGNADIAYFQKWRAKFPSTTFSLVPGNHDRLRAEQYAEMGIERLSHQYVRGPFCITHGHLMERHSCYCISGHLHPGVVIHGPARQRLRLPAFVQTQHSFYLPAFSSFTGLSPVKEEPCKFFAIAEQGIIAL